MTNIVDTSMETVNAEFNAAEKAIGPDPEVEAKQQEEQAQTALEEAQRQAEIQMASGMISTSLKLAIGSFVGVSVDDEYCDEAAKSYAVLIIKYFPGGIFALLDRYKEELAAATATFVLVKAVTTTKAKQREEEEKQATEEKQKAKEENNGQA